MQDANESAYSQKRTFVGALEAQNQAIGWLRKGCSSLGGGTSQRWRLFLAPVLRAQVSSWDYQPPGSAGEAYIRNTMPIGELERRARFPAV